MIDYSGCGAATEVFTNIPPERVTQSFHTSNYQGGGQPKWRAVNQTIPLWPGNADPVPYNTRVCSLQFDIPNDIGPPVLFYYRLTNFYQNHRRYVVSQDPQQLQGEFRSNDSIASSDCDPLQLNGTGFAYYPCGLIANSMFNDTFNNITLLNPANGSESSQYLMLPEDIAWEADADLYGDTTYTNDQVAPPPNWMERFPDGYTENHPIPNLHPWEPFHVWMRTAGLPTFSKAALRNDTHVMPSGTYQVDIYDCGFPYEPQHQDLC